MNTIYKKIGALGMILLLLGSSAVFAQPAAKNGAPPGLEGKQMPPGFEKRQIPRPHIEPLLSAQGFALSGDEFHLLSVSVTRTRVLPPKDVQGMLRGNRSFEEMLGELEKDGRAVVTRGTLKFGTKNYALNITRFDNKTMEADIVTLPPREPRMPPINESVAREVVGHIKLSISAYEGARVATGEVTMEGKSYRALLVAIPQTRALGRGAPESVEPPMKERGEFGKNKPQPQGAPGIQGRAPPVERGAPFQFRFPF